MARSATGVVRVTAIRLLIWFSSNHPAVACGRGCPSLSKEGRLKAESRDRNYLMKIAIFLRTLHRARSSVAAKLLSR